jgi:cyclase
MLLKIRIIPTLLWKDFGLVKGLSFNSNRRIGSVLPAIKIYNKREVDELILLDINATLDNREPDYESISEFSKECFMPLTVGGGIKNVDHIKKILRAGADKVSLNSFLYQNPNLIKEASDRFGSQCIVVSIDVIKNSRGSYECHSHAGGIPTGIEVVEWAKKVEILGAGEILISSVKKDGSMEGYDLELIKKVTEAVNIPVIASGGAGNYSHLLEVINETGVSAVAAASMFHFTEQTPKEAKKHLQSNGILVRNANIEK